MQPIDSAWPSTIEMWRALAIDWKSGDSCSKPQELIIWEIIQIKLVSVQKLDYNKVCNKYPMEILEELKVKINVD